MENNNPIDTDFVGLSGADMFNPRQSGLPQPVEPKMPEISNALESYLIDNKIGNYEKQNPFSFELPGQYNPEQNLEALFSNVNLNGLNVQTDPFTLGKQLPFDARNPNLQNQFYERYLNHPDFKELGFSPFRDNETLYNEHSSFVDDIRRASGSWATLAGLGLKDAMSFGSLTDYGTAAQFEKAVAIGQSSKGGVSGFTTNLYLNSGYTIGILAELALEEVAMAGALAALGVSSVTPAAPVAAPAAAATATAMAARGVSAANKIRNAISAAGKIGQTIGNLKDVNKAREYFYAGLKGTANVLNPLENTADFFKNYNKLDGLKNWQKSVKGFSEFYKDAQNIRLGWGESGLEGGMVQNQLERDLLEEFKNTNGRAPSDSEAEELRQLSHAGGQTTGMWNVPLILLSNKLTFQGLLRPGMRKLGTEVIESVAGKKILFNPKNALKDAYTKLPSEFLARQAVYIQNPKLIVGNMLKYSTANFAEGLQEVGQETLAAAAEDYYTEKFRGDATRGGYHNYLLSNFGGGHGIGETTEVFLSGFLMGGLIAPVSNTIASAAQGNMASQDTALGKVGSILRNGLIKSVDYSNAGITSLTKGKEKSKEILERSAKRFKDQEEKLADSKVQIENELDEQVKILNKIYKDPTLYLSPNLSNLLEQKEYSRLMDIAEKNGDTRTFMDMKDSSLIQHALTAARYGQIGSLVERMESLKKLSAEDIADGSITNLPYDQYQKELDSSIKYAKQIDRTWKELNTKFPNPNNPLIYKHGTREWEAASRDKIAWDNALAEIAFNQASFLRTLARRKKMLDEAIKVSGLENAGYSDISVLYSSEDANTELQTLNLEIKTFEQAEIIDEQLKKVYKEKLAKRDALIEFNKVLDELKAEVATIASLEQVSEKTFDKLEKVYEDYMKVISDKSGDFTNRDALKNSLQNIIDYHILEKRSKALNTAVNIVLDPKVFLNKVKRASAINEMLMRNREQEIRRSLEEFKKVKESNDMLNELYDLGVFINPKDIKKLEEEGIVPKALYTHIDGKVSEVPITDAKYKEALGVLEKHMSKKGIELKNIFITSRQDPYVSKSRNKNPDDKRTYKQLAAQFKFNPNEPLSEVPLKDVLQTIIDSPYSSDREVELATKLLESTPDNVKVKFKDNNKGGYYSATEGIVIDARWSANDYMQGENNHPIEHDILHQEMKRRIDGALDDVKFKEEMEELRDTALAEFQKLSPIEKIMYGGYPQGNISHLAFVSLDEFIAQTMSSDNFQKFLARVKHTQDTSNSLWTRFVDAIIKNIEKIVGKAPNGTVLNAALEKIITKIDPTVSGTATKKQSTGKAANAVDITKITAEDLQKNHPELAKELLENYRNQEAQRKKDGQNYFVGFENLSDAELLDSPQFNNYLKFNASSSKQKIVNEYNDSLKAKEPQTSAPEDVVKEIGDSVTDEEYINFKNSKRVEKKRILMLAKKKKNNIAFNDREQEMYDAAVKGQDNLVDLAIKDSLITYTTKSKDLLNKILSLGFSRAFYQNKSLGKLNEIVQNFITAEEYDMLQATGSVIDDVDPAKVIEYQTLVDDILDSIKTGADLIIAKEMLENLYIDDPQFSLALNLSDFEEIDKLIENKRQDLVKNFKFEDILINEVIVLNDGKNTKAIVLEKSDNTISVMLLDPSNMVISINSEDTKTKIKYKWSSVMKSEDVTETGALTPEDEVAAKGSVQTVENIDDTAIIAQDKTAADTKSPEDINNDLLNSFNNNCE